MSDHQDYVYIIAREVYEGRWKKEDVPAIVDDYSWKSPEFKKLYQEMSNLAIKRFDNAVWRRVEELQRLELQKEVRQALNEFDAWQDEEESRFNKGYRQW